MSVNTKADASERCAAGISKHITKAYTEIQRALAFSLEEGSETIEEKLCKMLVDIEEVATMNFTCGRNWDDEIQN